MARTFTLIHSLGESAHGSVHLAEVRDDDNYVQTLALKRLHPEFTEEEGLVARLEEEARLLALLHHDNIVRVHGFTTIDGALAIQMEPVHGVDLARLTERLTLPARVSTEIVVAVADALDAAWTAQPSGQSQPLRVSHRDLKPWNIMVTPRGGVRLLDFGIARATLDTDEIEKLGSAAYIAPERWLRGEMSHASDIYALGIVFAELLTGSAYQLGPEPSEFEADREAMLEELDLPELRELLARMTAFDPADRPAAVDVVTSALELLPQIAGSDLRTWAGQYVVVDATPAVDRSNDNLMVMREDTTDVGLPVLTPVPLETRPERSFSWLAMGSAIAAAAVVISMLAWIWTARGGVPSAAAPVPVAAAVPVDELRPEATLAAAPEANDGRVALKFLVAPGLRATSAFGELTGPGRVLRLPAGEVVEVRVVEGKKTWSCSVTVGPANREVRIRPEAQGGCTP